MLEGTEAHRASPGQGAMPLRRSGYSAPQTWQLQARPAIVTRRGFCGSSGGIPWAADVHWVELIRRPETRTLGSASEVAQSIALVGDLSFSSCVLDSL